MRRRSAARAARVVCALAVLAVAFARTDASAATWRSLAPAKYGAKADILVDSKTLTYYRFDSVAPLTLSVEGPTRLKILTRVRIPNDRDEGTYSVTVTRDGGHAVTEEFTAGVSEQAHYVAFNSFRPGVIRRLYIDVPTGQHGYEILAVGAAVVDARPFQSAADRPSRVSIAPREYAAVETFYYRDKELVYYILTEDAPVVLDVVGPTAIKVNTRLVFDQTMLDAQSYALGVREYGAPEQLYRIETEPSETVTSRDRSDVIPGALRHFMLEVGRGAHTYEFRLADTVGAAVALKFYIPRGDLLNEP
jgi:hypothetical protein